MSQNQQEKMTQRDKAVQEKTIPQEKMTQQEKEQAYRQHVEQTNTVCLSAWRKPLPWEESSV